MRLLAALTVAAVLAAGPVAGAAAACPRTSVAAIEDDVMCPVCGTSLALARESAQAQRERAFIARLARQCRSRRQIEDALVAQFGPAVLAAPRAGGFGLTAYAVPLAVLLVAAATLAATAVRVTRSRRVAEAEPPPLTDDEARRLALELRRTE